MQPPLVVNNTWVAYIGLAGEGRFVKMVGLKEKMAVDARKQEPLPNDLLRPIERLRKLIHQYVLLEGVVVAALFAIAAFWFFGLMDYVPIRLGANESPRLARMVMLVLTFGGAAFLFFKLGFITWLVHWPESSLALRIEQSFPALRGLLSTSVLAHTNPREYADLETISIHHAMMEDVFHQAYRAVETLPVDEVIDWKPLRQKSWILLGVMILSMLVSLLQPGWVWHWSKRFLALSAEPWPRSVKLDVEGIEFSIPTFAGQTVAARYMRPFRDQQTTIIRGQAGVLKVLADRSAPKTPEYCSIYYRSEDGTSGRANLRRLASNQSEYESFVLEGPPLESMDQAMQFTVMAEDLKLPRHSVLLVDSPIVQEVRLSVEYPKYLQSTTSGNYLSEELEFKNGLRLPQGAGVVFKAKANRQLSRIDYAITTTSDSEPQRSQGTLDVSGDHFEIEVWKPNSLTQNATIEFLLWDADGLCADRIQSYVLSFIMDDVPKVDMVLQGIGSAVTPNATIPIQATIQDDYGVKEAAIEFTANESPVLRQSLVMDKDGQSRADLDLDSLAASSQLPIRVQSTLALTVSGTDHFDLGQQQHVGRAAPIQLAVVTPQALIILLEKRELAMRVRLEQVISEMNQMRDLLGKLKASDRKESAVDESDDSTQSETRLQILRVQQSIMQASKSEGELRGIAREIGQIALELVNNKVDAKDRRERLVEKVQRPIESICSDRYPLLHQALKKVEQFESGGEIREPIQDSLNATDDILVRLRDVLQNMIDIQDFNELIDMVRDLVDEQQKILDSTKKEQKKQVLDLFK